MITYQMLTSRATGFTLVFFGGGVHVAHLFWWWGPCCSSLMVVGSMLLVFFGGGVHVARLFNFLCCVLFSLSFVLSAQCCQCLWIVHSWLSLRFSLIFMSYNSLIDEHIVILNIHKWYIQSCHVIKSLSVIVWTMHV